MRMNARKFLAAAAGLSAVVGFFLASATMAPAQEDENYYVGTELCTE